ncbi:hypothetical protein [Microbacterium sp. Kw_RZR3]|uniref:hypothetical protein n=1 Tax=unclassified Microbacterium TaxID=2609290 RepID=UPI0023DAB325|nr:hypothetical protein [Microbacterium sp. Kw_RZR3]
MMATPRRKSSLRLKVFGSIFLLMVGVVVFFLFVAPSLERNALTTWQCDVTSAEPHESSGTFKGSTTLPSVLLHTSDCGDIALQNGVTFDNNTEIAADFVPGTYDFQIGWVSAFLIRLLPNGLPEAQSYEPVS